jgi:hypothetical protein
MKLKLDFCYAGKYCLGRLKLPYVSINAPLYQLSGSKSGNKRHFSGELILAKRQWSVGLINKCLGCIIILQVSSWTDHRPL